MKMCDLKLVAFFSSTTGGQCCVLTCNLANVRGTLDLANKIIQHCWVINASKAGFWRAAAD